MEYNVQAVQNMSKVSEFPHISSLLAKAVELKANLSKMNQHSSKASHPSSAGWASSPPPTASMSSIPTSSPQGHSTDSQLDDDELKPKTFD